MNKLLMLTATVIFASAAPPADAAPLKALKVATGESHACALLSDRRLKCWGLNFSGQLGLGDAFNRGTSAGSMGDALPFVDVGTGADRIRQLALGDSHTCVLFGVNGVKCWGSNSSGQLGLGDEDRRGDGVGEMGSYLPLVVVSPPGVLISSLVAGGNHTCALLEDGVVRCWGDNSHGQLGIENTDDHGNDWLEFPGDVSVNLGTGRTALQITAGYSHTCALLDDATVKCWGMNSSGQLGLGDVADRGGAIGDMGDLLPAVDLGNSGTPVKLAAGDSHTCALFLAGNVKCWGRGSSGELGSNDWQNLGNGSGEMGDYLPFIDFHGDFEPVDSLSLGNAYSCVTSNGKVVCWGFNSDGQLGQGHDLRIGDDAMEMQSQSLDADLGGASVFQVDAGGFFTCARFFNGRIKCWGFNGYGQLGLGDTANRGEDADGLADDLPYLNLGDDGVRGAPGNPLEFPR